MSRNKCCVPGCQVVKDDGIPLHRFPDPKSNLEKYMTWVSTIGSLHLLQDKKYVYNNLRVCRKHFRAVYLYPNHQLCKLAIPELQLSAQERERAPENLPPTSASQAQLIMNVDTQIVEPQGSSENLPLNTDVGIPLEQHGIRDHHPSTLRWKHQTSIDSQAKVLSIQSHVVHGYVGNKSAVFPLQVLGFEVDAINTVQFSTHTGYKHIKGTVLKNEEMEELMDGLMMNEVDYYTHFLTGYSRSPDSLKQIAEIIKKLRQKNPKLVYACDPVMGDNGKMYVPESVLPVYRDVLVPLADILTPNQFEAELITGVSMTDLDGALRVIKALHDRGVKTVVLSSTELGDGETMLGIASNKDSCYKIEIPKLDTNFTGTGDLFAALFLAWSHKTNDNIKLTLEKTIATLQIIVNDTYSTARAIHPTGKIPPELIELRIIQNKASIEDPLITIQATEI